MAEFSTPVKYNERGQRVKDAQFILDGNNYFKHDWFSGTRDGVWGKQSMADADGARWDLGYPEEECATGLFGQKLYDFLRTDAARLPLPKAYEAARAKRALSKQQPPLPANVHFPDQSYPEIDTDWGVQPWIVPQVHAICDRFGLTVTAGWGGHPPHAIYSDHRWGGAVDLAGPLQAMIDCTLWADGLALGFYRKGAVFRWVGGPAHDANGVEPGHYSHVHCSWYRLGPATTVFGTTGFPR